MHGPLVHVLDWIVVESASSTVLNVYRPSEGTQAESIISSRTLLHLQRESIQGLYKDQT